MNLEKNATLKPKHTLIRSEFMLSQISTNYTQQLTSPKLGLCVSPKDIGTVQGKKRSVLARLKEHVTFVGWVEACRLSPSV